MTIQQNKAIEVLCSEPLKHIVDLVINRIDKNVYSVQNSSGKVVYERADGSNSDFRVVSIEGVDPLRNQDLTAFDSLEEQRKNMFPANSINHYPHAFERIAQVFDHKDRPDLIVTHSAAHNFVEKGGYLGEHGSLDIIQSRAPFIISGNCVKNQGIIDGHIKAVDVLPTLLELIVSSNDQNKLDELAVFKSNMDGRPNKTLIDSFLKINEIDHVIVFLLDGCNSNILYSMINSGDLPNLGALVDNGVALKQGTISSFPSVTLANHTSLLTGLHPGHHGVLHNAWWNRENQQQIVTESPTTWHTSMQYLNPGVLTGFDILAKLFDEGTTLAINEFADCGADYSTFDLMRNFRSDILVSAADLNSDPLGFISEKYKDDQEYQLGSSVDHLAVKQFLNILDGNWDSRHFDLPLFSWINLTLTDVCFHASGPDSKMARSALKDTDKRVGMAINKLNDKRILDRSLVVVLADHGMEETNPAVKGDWDQALIDSGIDFVDESYGFIYFKD